jgi:ferric citrate transport system substrate-binding protein
MEGALVKKRIGAVALLVALCSLVVAGAAVSAPAKAAAKKFDQTCGKARTAQRTVNHTLGSTVMHGTPKRIVALEFSFIDDLAAIGVKPVGLTDDNDPSRIIPAVRSKIGNYTSVGLRGTPNLETIASLHPDLIIADSDRHATIYKQLSNIAPTIALDSLKQAYLPQLHAAIVIGQAVNRCGAMRVRVAQDKAVFARLRAAVPKNEQRKALFAVTTNKIFNMHNGLAYTPSLLTALGIPTIHMPAKLSDNPYEQLTLESLLTYNPDIMFLAQSPPEPTTDETFAKTPLWGQLNAVKNREVFVVDQNLWSRARGLIAGEEIAQQAVKLLYDKNVSIALPKVTVK